MHLGRGRWQNHYDPFPVCSNLSPGHPLIYVLPLGVASCSLKRVLLAWKDPEFAFNSTSITDFMSYSTFTLRLDRSLLAEGVIMG